MLPRWAKRLLEQDPGREMPTAENPIPAWVEEEVSEKPLWYIIRESKEVRTEHPFIVLDEIKRQPAQWAEVLKGKSQASDLAVTIQEMGIQEVVFIGCGSAFFTAMHSEFVFPRLAGIPARAVEAFEMIHYFPEVNPERTLVAAHSGTGGSIETIEALKVAREKGCKTLAICNTPNSPLKEMADYELLFETKQRCGPCISVVSTRILYVTLLALALGRLRGRENGDLAAQVELCPEIGAEFLDSQEEKIVSLARALKDRASWFLIGTGPNYFSAREGTLKIEEESITVNKAYRPGDFHHDALSLLSEDRVVVAIPSPSKANDRIIDCLRAAREGRASTVGLALGDNRSLSEYSDFTVEIAGGLDELLTPIPLTLPFQLIGYYLGVERGYNPDTLRTDHLPNARAWLTSFPIGTH